jgi:catechol 2,3-dioxygenase-like lactoylglutathione lyase family enzyme
MQRIIELVAAAAFAAAAGAAAADDLSAPNKAGVAMGHLHYVVRDVAANKAFWVALGGRSVLFNGTTEGIVFPDVVVLLRQGESTGGTEGSVVNHVAFRVKSLAAIERAGFAVEYNAQYPGVASVHTPEGERIELFDDELATNLDFTIDARQRPPGTAGVPQMQEQFAADAVAERHNRKIAVPIIAHHIHLNVPQDQVAAAKEWYATHFGGVRGKRWRYDAVDLPGININISGVDTAQAPTRGRMLVTSVSSSEPRGFCKQLEAAGVKFDQPYSIAVGFGLAFLTDPGATIELTEGRPCARPGQRVLRPASRSGDGRLPISRPAALLVRLVAALALAYGLPQQILDLTVHAAQLVGRPLLDLLQARAAAATNDLRSSATISCTACPHDDRAASAVPHSTTADCDHGGLALLVELHDCFTRARAAPCRPC